MSWIQVIDERQATGELKAQYDEVQRTRGRVSNVMKAHGLDPKIDEVAPRPLPPPNVWNINTDKSSAGNDRSGRLTIEQLQILRNTPRRSITSPYA